MTRVPVETLKGRTKIRKKTELKIEIEVKNLEELKLVLQEGKGLVDIIMLDNFSLSDVKKAVLMNKRCFRLEISGGVNKSNKRKKLKKKF